MTGSVAPDELLARYITSSRWFHKQDLTVKQDAFIPSDSELSVTRHLHLTEEDIWKIGRKIAEGMPRSLHGRADVETSHVIAQGLDVVPQPVDGNHNHANIINWPPDKDDRKMCALGIARVAHFVANPEGKV
ncbi:MAG: hypothetical protein MUP16_12685 [Sedimentisphaerales bacterium]|nr:hypothetical protein [Sedimentisphaerales bacterium]